MSFTKSHESENTIKYYTNHKSNRILMKAKKYSNVDTPDIWSIEGYVMNKAGEIVGKIEPFAHCGNKSWAKKALNNTIESYQPGEFVEMAH